MAVRMCAGMSSGPSASWMYFADSGTSCAMKFAKSFNTSGSAFSWMIKLADVWRKNRVQSPVSTFDSATISAMFDVMLRSDLALVDILSNF